MSFFFSKLQKEKATKKVTRGGPRKPGAAAPTNRAKLSAETLNRLGCKVCPLANRPGPVEARIPKKDTTVFLLAEAPTSLEVEKGKPFLTKGSKLLKEQIPESMRKSTGLGYLIKHVPSGDSGATWHEIECCRTYLAKTIEAARPAVVLGLGPTVLSALFGTTDIFGLRGRQFAMQFGEHKCWFIPTFDPDFMMKQAYDKEKPLNHKFGLAFKLDIQAAYELAREGGEPIVLDSKEAKADINIYGTDIAKYQDLIAEFDKADEQELISIDLETYQLRPYSQDAQILTASISYFREDDSIHTFAFSIAHTAQVWTTKQVATIRSRFKGLLQKDSVKVAHNAPFEVEWLYNEFGAEIVQHDNWEDTMMMAHLLDERRGPGKEEDRRAKYQSLDFLTKQHFGLPVKKLFNLNKKDMRKTDLQQCLHYNGVDTKVTLLLYVRQLELLEESDLLETYNHTIPRSTALAVMQHVGVDVDQDVVQRFSDKLAGEIGSIFNEIQELKVIKHYKRDKGSFNPSSTHEVLEVFRDYLKRKEVTVAKKNSTSVSDTREAVDKNVLSQIDHPLSALIIKYRNRSKLKATYVDELKLGSGSIIYPDGKIHSSFNATATETGRLSSDEPNLQNIPKRDDKWIREQVQPKLIKLKKRVLKQVILSVDYGQLEWCVGCMCSKDKAMVDATWEGYDVHMAWAIKIAKRWPELVGGKKYLKDDAAMARARGLVKNKMVFPAIFGAQESSIAGYLNMPESVSRPIFEEFWSTFSGLASWQKQLMRSYYEKGYVENLIGRRRRAPMTRNAAINHPVQSTGAEIVCDAMTELSKIAIETDRMWLHPRMNIHDDLTFVIPDDDEILDEAIGIIVTEMLRLPYDFINVPMAVEAEIGYDWAHMDKIEKFWTTDWREEPIKRK